MDSLLFKSEIENLPQFKQLKNIVKLPKLSENANQMLSTFYKRIDYSKKMFVNYSSNIYESLTNETQLKKSENHNWIPRSLCGMIDNVCVNNVSFLVEVPIRNTLFNRKFKIFLGMPSHYTERNLINIIEMISCWFHFVNDFVEDGCSNTVNIHIFMIPEKKDLPDDHEVIDKDDVNTAFTTTCRLHTNVNIFREEEWFRALIHESFHNLGLDFIRMDASPIEMNQNRIKKVFPIQVADIRFYETYCEMWAEVLNLLFYVYYNKPEKKRWKSMFFEFFEFEQIFALWQCVKILRHNNISYINLKEQAPIYREKTQGFSYFVLKSILSVHLDQFLQFCATQFQDTRVTLEFRRTKHNLNQYTNLFLHNYKSDEMMYGTSILEPILQKKNKNSPFVKTLRMSLFEIKY
jgi:hypothetical protein